MHSECVRTSSQEMKSPVKVGRMNMLFTRTPEYTPIKRSNLPAIVLSASKSPAKGNILPLVTSHSSNKPTELTDDGHDLLKSNAKIEDLLKVKSSRRRTLSERAVKQAEFPVIEKNIVKNSFVGCKYISDGVRRGVGLLNRSNFCFMNSVLQCIVHLPQLARLIVDYHQKKTCQKRMLNKCFWCYLKAHVVRVMTIRDAFEPNSLKMFLSGIFGRPFEGDQEDAHEFFTLLLDTLEKVYPSSHVLGDNLSLLAEPSNPIEQVLSGTMRNEIHCPNCKSMKVNYERYRELNVSLPSIAFKKGQVPTLTMTRLFNYFFEPEELDGYKCEECKTTVTAIKKSILLRAPNVLLIQLKRFNFYGKKIKTNLKTEMEINLQPHMYNSSTPMKYKLQSYIEHHGTNIAFGHYTTVCRDLAQNKFSHYDDDAVYDMSDSEMETMNPYVLIYTLISPNETNLTNDKVGLKRSNDNSAEITGSVKHCAKMNYSSQSTPVSSSTTPQKKKNLFPNKEWLNQPRPESFQFNRSNQRNHKCGDSAGNNKKRRKFINNRSFKNKLFKNRPPFRRF